MKNTKFIWIAGTALGLALSLGACDKKSDETPQSSVGSAPSPAPEPSAPEQPSTSQGSSSDTGTAGTTQGQKPDDASKAQQKG